MTTLDGHKYSCYHLRKMDEKMSSLLVAAQAEETRRVRMSRKQEYMEYRHLQTLYSRTPGLRLRPNKSSVPKPPGSRPVVPQPGS